LELTNYTDIKLTFLGTGTSQGVPVVACQCEVCKSDDYRDKRLRTSALLQINNINIAIDAGPDFRTQMLREKVNKLHAVLLTHGHKDHVGGLDDVRAYNYFMKKTMDVYASEEVNRQIMNEYAYAFGDNKYPGVPDINLHNITNSKFFINEIEIIPIQVLHYKMPVFGYKFGKIAYITDANYISEIEKEKLKGLKILVINALRRKKHYSHFNLEEALQLIAEVKPEQAYLTHLSHQIGLTRDLEKELPSNVMLAYDGLKIICKNVG